MARKGKDLFVMLAERQQVRTGQMRRKAEGDGGGAAGTGEGELGARLGRWVQGAMRTLKPEETTNRKRPRGDERVPRGLLVPGWLLAGMLLLALGSGFAVGRATGRAKADQGLDQGTRTVAKPGDFLRPGQQGFLGDKAAEEVLGDFFYKVKAFYPEEKQEAAMLAQQLRARGLHRTRIYSYQNGSTRLWVTLCYADPKSTTGKGNPNAAGLVQQWDEPTLRALNEHAAELGYPKIEIETLNSF